MRKASDLFTREAATAAKWWADHLCRTGNTIEIEIRGPIDSDSVKAASRLHAAVLGVAGVSPEMKSAFQSRLEVLIQERLIAENGRLYMGTDPQLDELLLEAARYARIPVSGSTFPAGSGIWISPGKVEARLGPDGERYELTLE